MLFQDQQEKKKLKNNSLWQLFIDKLTNFSLCCGRNGHNKEATLFVSLKVGAIAHFQT